MTWLRSEEEVEQIIDDMKTRSKGKYITQGVSFNKSCPRQMELLKKALMSSASFSGLGKELLAVKFNGGGAIQAPQPIIEKPKVKNVGNFL
jgi:hypothetical protein